MIIFRIGVWCSQSDSFCDLCGDLIADSVELGDYVLLYTDEVSCEVSNRMAFIKNCFSTLLREL